MRSRLLTYWNKIGSKYQYLIHVCLITALVFFMIFLGTSFKINIKSINPLTRSLNDYEITDIVFSKFKDQSEFIEDIIIVNTGTPDRSEITKILKKISPLETKAIGIDFLFSEFDSSDVDIAFVNQLAATPNIVLASILDEFNVSENHFGKLSGCAPAFCDNTNVGYINFVAKPDHSIRLFSTMESVGNKIEKAFSTRLFELAYPERSSEITEHPSNVQRIGYRGNIESFVHFDADQLLNNSGDLTQIFKDKIVLIGYLGDDDIGDSLKDKFYTPLNERIAAKSRPDMYGIMIHANILSMYINQSYIKEWPKWTNRLIEILIVMLSVGIFRMDFISFQQVYWILIRILQILMYLLLFYIVAGVFYFFNIRLSLNIGIIGALIAWDVVDLYENIIHPRLKKIIFGHTEESIQLKSNQS